MTLCHVNVDIGLFYILFLCSHCCFLPSFPVDCHTSCDVCLISEVVADYMTLSESQDSSLNKRLSSSSAALPSVTERGKCVCVGVSVPVFGLAASEIAVINHAYSICPVSPCVLPNVISDPCSLVPFCPHLASSPHRSPYRGSPSRAERKKNTSGTTGVMDESKDIATILKTAQVRHLTCGITFLAQSKWTHLVQTVIFGAQHCGTHVAVELVS